MIFWSGSRGIKARLFGATGTLINEISVFDGPPYFSWNQTINR